MSDIVERARAADDRDMHLDVLIDKMAAEIEKLREALKFVLQAARWGFDDDIMRRVREALGDAPDQRD